MSTYPDIIMKRSLQSIVALSSTLAATSLAVTKTSNLLTGTTSSSRSRDEDDTNNNKNGPPSSSAITSHHSERTAARKLQSVCQSCHVGLPLGPPFWREQVCLFDQPAGSVYPDYPYTQALKDSGLVWNETSLDAWLEDPSGVVPGNVMSFGGLKDPQERKDVIAILKSFCDEEGGGGNNSTTSTEDPTASPSSMEDSSDGSSGAPVLADHYLWMGPAMLVGWVLLGSGRR